LPAPLGGSGLLALYALALQAMLACSLAANVTPYTPLPGAPSGYVVEAWAPPGSRLLLYPAPGAPPLPLTETSTVGSCAVYRAGPLALSPGAYIVARLPGGGEARLSLRLPSSSDEAVTAVSPVYAVGGNVSGILVSSAGEHGLVKTGARGGAGHAARVFASTTAAGQHLAGNTGTDGGVDVVTLVGAVLLLLAWLALHLLSVRGGRLGGGGEAL
jgi:hypothetical protein